LATRGVKWRSPLGGISAANVAGEYPEFDAAAALNGGSDDGADDDQDLSRFIPGARRAVAGTGHHGNAPSDPLFQAELIRFGLEPDR